jgi:Tol biopolymer transport system component
LSTVVQVAPGTIAFARTDAGADIYVIQTDGTGLTRLAGGPGSWLEHPAWSPDGTRIAYHSGFGPHRTFSVWVMNADGSDRVQLTQVPPGCLWPTWSPDGSHIAFTLHSPETRRFNIYMMDADGSDLSSLTSGATDDLFPAWAPDGTILFLRKQQGAASPLGDVFAVHPDGGEVVQVTMQGHVGGYALSPDGTRIAIHDTAQSRIMVIPMNAPGTPATLVDTDFGCLFVAIAWSPDAQALALACSDYMLHIGSDLYIVNADGSGLTAIPIPEGAFDPSWGPP